MTKETIIYNGKKQSLQQVVLGKLVTRKLMKLEYTLTEYIRINSKWLKDLNIRHDTIKIPKENTGKTLLDKLHQYFLWSVFQDNRNKSKNKWDLIKFLSLCTAKKKS